jgi:hypothetical protein
MDKGGKCFIATAAYGSEVAEEVDILRSFRDQRLYTTAFGQKIHRLYYELSPGVACYISRHRGAASVTRIMLRPIIALVRVVMQGYENQARS